MEHLTDVLNRLRNRHITLMQRTLKTLDHIVRATSHEDMTTWRDGGEGGWTALEVLCHVRDFSAIFHERALSVIEQDNPAFIRRDHLQMVIDKKYNEQDPIAVLEALATSRASLVAFYEALTPEQLARTGIHAEYGLQTLYDLIQQVGHHDTDHIEQLTRILLLKQQ